MMDHLALLAVDLDDLALQERPQLRQVTTRLAPRESLLVEYPARGRSGAPAAYEPARSQPLDRGDRRCRRHDMAQIGNEYCRTDVDRRLLGDARQRDPYVFVQRSRVVEPHTVVPEVVGQLRQLDRIRPGWHSNGKLHARRLKEIRFSQSNVEISPTFDRENWVSEG